jgi:single-strand DNA-binding protein
MNFLNLAGHLGADPETRFTSNGKKVTTLRLATRSRRGKNNDETIWWRVTVWGETYDAMLPHLKKGSAIMVCGEMHKPEIFTDRDGKPQVSMEITASYIQFSPFGKPAGTQQASGSQVGHQGEAQPPFGAQPLDPYAGARPGAAAPVQGETFDDEVPF